MTSTDPNSPASLAAASAASPAGHCDDGCCVTPTGHLSDTAESRAHKAVAVSFFLVAPYLGV